MARLAAHSTYPHDLLVIEIPTLTPVPESMVGIQRQEGREGKCYVTRAPSCTMLPGRLNAVSSNLHVVLGYV